MSVSTSDPMIGRVIDGRYQVRSRIARGGMATVYLATDLRLERRVAVKVMHRHLADDSQFKQRFIQEARSAARLAHPNVVSVFDEGEDENDAYLVMEYLPGITLRDLLIEYGPLTSEQTIHITEAVLSGLAAAHKAGIIHRDLKPENVLLADDGRIKIGDFGLARAASGNSATGAALLGTFAYLSPELVTRGVADTRSDIYAVGIMMFEMLTGEQPFKGERPMLIAYQHANDTVPAPSTKNPKVPTEFDELVGRATSRDPEQRPSDARAMLDQLRETESRLRTAQRGTTAHRAVAMPAAAAVDGILQFSDDLFDIESSLLDAFKEPKSRQVIGRPGSEYSATLRAINAASGAKLRQADNASDPIVANVKIDRGLVRAASKVPLGFPIVLLLIASVAVLILGLAMTSLSSALTLAGASLSLAALVAESLIRRSDSSYKLATRRSAGKGGTRK